MSLPVLLPDLIVEIISWLPVKPVVRFKCVSKHYQSIISDPKFAKLHLQRAPKNPHTLLTLRDVDYDDDEEIWVVAPYLVRHLIEHPSSVVKEDECRHFNDNNDYYTIGSINGLVCLISKKEQDGNKEICTQFWNPTLRLRSKDSPNLSIMPPNDEMMDHVNLGFGYDDFNDRGKRNKRRMLPLSSSNSPSDANQLIMHAVYPFIQTGRRSTTNHWGLTSHQS